MIGGDRQLERIRAGEVRELAGLRVAIDVQHLYRPDRPRDHGATVRLANGTTITEAELATGYAGHAAAELEARGALVLRNDPARGVLVGHYSSRARAASSWGARVYLACHVNAGGGDYARAYGVGSRGVQLARDIVLELDRVSRLIDEGQALELRPGERGWVCIAGAVAPTLGILLEPFFLDTPGHRGLVSAAGLGVVGRAIGRSVGAWWLRQPVPTA